MNTRWQMNSVKHLQGHVLRVAYADGITIDYDFAPWLESTRRTPFEKRYRAVEWFKRFKAHPGFLEWGDLLIGMDAEDLREGHITGVEVRRQQAA